MSERFWCDGSYGMVPLGDKKAEDFSHNQMPELWIRAADVDKRAEARAEKLERQRDTLWLSSV